MKKKSVAILGSTGSIGQSTLDIIKSSNNFKVELLLANKNYFKIIKQIEFFKPNIVISSQFKMVLMGEGSKILDNQFKDKISFSNDIDFLEETLEDICQSGFKFGTGLNKQEVVVIPKKLIKQGFFEKLFHLFR